MIVDAPAKVLGTGAGTETPPTVTVRLLHQLTEAVDIAVAEEIRHPLPFLGQEARRRVMLPRIINVNILMTDVVVA